MEEVDFKEWQKLDLRVGKIVGVEDIEGADKLYKLKVDAGEEEPRVLVAGIKKDYSKEELNGKKCIVLLNLQPKKLKGIESRGMLLAAVGDEKIGLLIPDKDISAGSKIM